MGLVLVALLVFAVALVAAIVIAVRNQRAGVTGRSHDPAIDPFAVGEPWRRLVQSAVRSQVRYRDTFTALPTGPMRDHLFEIGDHVDEAVSECWRIAKRGHDLGRVLDGMAIARTREQLVTISADANEPAVVDRAEALRSRIATYDRIAASNAGTEQQLRLLVARLEETSARGAELSLTAGATPELDALGTDVSGVVDELEALRLAFDDVGPRRELGR